MQDELRRFKAGIFQALAHATRIAIVELLRDEGEIPVSRIYERWAWSKPTPRSTWRCCAPSRS